MRWKLPRVMALSAGGEGDPGVVIAASRAGALGVLDYGLGDGAVGSGRVLQQTSRYLKDRPFGIRLPLEALERLDLAGSPAVLRVVIACGGSTADESTWARAVAGVRGTGRIVVAEVTSREAALAAAAAGCEALIVAGNEAGGHVATDSTFILLQAVLAHEVPPVWVRGGIGPWSAAACVAAGAAGVVLDGSLLLAKESALGRSMRERVERWDGGETVVLGRSTGAPVRVQADPGSPALARLKEAVAQSRTAWDRTVRLEIGWGEGQVRPVGQDAALAAALARRFVTVGGIVQEVERAIRDGLEDAKRSRPLAEGSPLAQAHGTRYPIVQGPMTRVSDVSAFAEAVAGAGALPFLALAMMKGPEVRALLRDASVRLEGRAWGVGVLGFVPPELRREQVEEIRRARPAFALIAGGRPDQARDLEREGIATYLHAPSPGLLRQYWNDGARRFVLEGRECGGHVGPRSSLLLWEQAVDVLLERLEGGADAEELHLLLAGGIHDARSAAAVAALAAPLARRGARIGVLIGTAYLFTTEAVSTGAIVPGFQAEALRCSETVLLETGPGHEVRVSPTPFVLTFEQERSRLLAAGLAADQVREALERMNAGRLRIAAKGLERRNGARSPLIAVADADQTTQGLYMLGQAATLRQRITTMAELHHEISAGGTARIERVAAERALMEPEGSIRPTPSDIAIVGMAAIVPGAADARAFWENTLRGEDAITEVPADRWDWRLYYDPDPKAPDKIVSKWGGFLPEIPFDPLRYGMPPSSLPSIEPLHLLTLEVVRAALDDAGYRERRFPRDRTAVVLGAGGGAAQLAMGYAFRSYLPLLDTVDPGAGTEALERSKDRLPEWTEDSFAGILLNVAAGRVANRFDLGGANYTVDAACGSSLAAASVAVRELESGAADMVILGGVDTVQNPFTYLAFSKTQAFSPRGRCRPFDASADGIVISEAVAVVVLKRLADAERDGDRIYGVIKGLGASSDGRAKGLTAPSAEGQVRALRRAYAMSGVSPATVGYVEAHGTGTAAGDLAEVQALSEVFAEANTPRGHCALGSVKSLVGHTKCAAGLVGLINATLALYHEVLPPTIGVAELNPRARIPDSPFHVSTRLRPWVHAAADRPRRAGVSAFGFGGTNFHAVVEAYDGSHREAPCPLRDWPAELLVWRGPDREALLAQLDRLGQALGRGANPPLRDLAHTLLNSLEPPGASLAIVASSLGDLRAKLEDARSRIARGADCFSDPRGLEFAAGPAAAGTRIAFLFPGQGAQRLEMLGELGVLFPEVRRGFEAVDSVLGELGRDPVAPRIFPPPAFCDNELERQKAALAESEVAQPALGAAALGGLRLLEALEVFPDVLAGHSYGELVALHAAGVFSLEAFVELSESRGRIVKAAAGAEPGVMAALACGPDQAASLLEGLEGASGVNWNGPRQTVISGPPGPVSDALARARDKGIRGQKLPVACAFHSPLVAGATGPLEDLVGRLGARPPRRPVYSNLTAAPYSAEPAAIARQLGAHVARPVQFASMIEAMHADGARIFVEVGPGATLTPLVDSILGERPHLAVALEPAGRPGVVGLLQCLGRLFVAGVPIRLGRLTEGRTATILDRARFTAEPDRAESDATTAWLVNGTRARPAGGPGPVHLGPAPAARATPEPPGPRASTPQAPEPHRASHSKNGQSVPGTLPTTPRWSPAPAESDPGVDRVLEAFQKTMQNFLDVQRETMLAFLGGRNGDSHPPGARNGELQGDDRFLAADPDPLAECEPSPPSVPHPVGESQPSRCEPPGDPEPVPAGTVATAPPTEREAEPWKGRDDVADRLLSIVRDRTGYPSEMLRLDLDLEADLGIDSIKRVEILGSLREALPASGPGFSSETMDQLSRARTLGAIVERVSRALKLNGTHAGPAGAHAAGTNGHAAASTGAGESRDGIVRRMVLEAVESPLPLSSGELGLCPSGLVLISDDRRGVARAVAADLRAHGHPALVVGHDPAGRAEGDDEGEFLAVDLTSQAAVEALIDRLRRRGPLAGLVHALPLQALAPAGLDRDLWAARMGPEVQGLFLLARAAADDLARAASRGGAALVACTAMGGGFASVGPAPAEFFPGQGAVAGLAKTLAREWPKRVRVRVVDLDPHGDVEVLAANLVQELGARDQRTEVGYLDRRRMAIRVVERELPAEAQERLELAPGDPLLITGGARGITAVVAAELARRWRPTLLLLGTSPLPRGEESPRTAGVTSPAALKSILHDGLSREGKPIGPAELERAYQALRRQREIRANLERIRASGAHVEYATANVRDADALAAVLAGWRGRFGPPRGLIHGAGVIQDKLLRDKTLESFEHVLGTKVEGALNLARLVDPASLRFAAFFSSVAGRFGNRGQADYAAANEALNKLALWLDRRWPCRVVSMVWGPWSGVGMVSDLEAHLGRRGLGMIAPAHGASRLADELARGRKGDVEVVIAGEIGPLQDEEPEPSRTPYPLDRMAGADVLP